MEDTLKSNPLSLSGNLAQGKMPGFCEMSFRQSM